MNDQLLKLLCVLAFGVTVHTSGQGTFQNLGFESASLIPIPGDGYGRVQFSAAFPGWTGYVGGTPQDGALYDNEFLDSSGISIIDSGGNFGSVIEGNYTAILNAGLGLGTAQPADTKLSQTGLVPSGSRSFLFEARLLYGRPPTSFGVTLGGQSLALVALSTTGNYTLYGVDIHNWAGQPAELAFTLFSGTPHIDNAFLFLDAIRFSPQQIPEPSMFGLLGIAALVFGYIALCRQRGLAPGHATPQA